MQKLLILQLGKAEIKCNFANEIALLFSGKSVIYRLPIARLSHLKSILLSDII